MLARELVTRLRASEFPRFLARAPFDFLVARCSVAENVYLLCCVVTLKDQIIIE